MGEYVFETIKEDTIIVNSDIDEFFQMSQDTSMNIGVTFFDPPFNQKKHYAYHDDNMGWSKYWGWIEDILLKTYYHTRDGGAIYFMHREKNVAPVVQALNKTGWTVINQIIWKKMSSATPMKYGYGKNYQIIVYAIKGKKPTNFNKLRIDKPLLPNMKKPRTNGVYVTDVWDDIRELTSGYFAGGEAFRDKDGNRVHKQQAPIRLLLRILLSSGAPSEIVFDPFGGTGTTAIVAQQLGLRSISIELDPYNYEMMRVRLTNLRKYDRIEDERFYYRFTPNLDFIWRHRE